MSVKPLEHRPYQTRIETQTVNAFMSEKCRSVLIESPTGSGKTVIALRSLKKLQELNPKWTFGWVAMRRKLLKQAALENERVGVDRLHFVSMFDKSPPKVDFMITDEAQHDAASTCATLHTTMNAKYCLGLTATPFRTDRVKLCYERVIKDAGIRFLIEDGYLSQYHHYAIPSWTPEHVAAHFSKCPDRWGKSVIYMPNTKQCWNVCERLSESGIKAAVVGHEMKTDEQDRVYGEFEEGKIQVLINVYLLTEGFDAPDLKTVFVRNSGKLCTIQMSGRVLRLWPDGHAQKGTPKQVVQAANPHPQKTQWVFTKCAKAHRQWIYDETRDEWQGLEPGEKVDGISAFTRVRILSKPVAPLPDYIRRGGGARRLTLNKDGEVVIGGQRAPVLEGVSTLAYLFGTAPDMPQPGENVVQELASNMSEALDEAEGGEE